MKNLFKIILLHLFVLVISLNAQNVAVKIWPGDAPGTEGKLNEEKNDNGSISNVYQPDISVFLPKNVNTNNPALLVFPGGGYTHLAFEKEGIKIAKWLNENGIAAFVLKYRLNIADALADAQRALSFVRFNSVKYNINPDNIGAIGFSAGGHLAANLISHSQKNIIEDSVDSTSCRPDFVVLVYGWLQDQHDLVSKNNPPAFLVHASDDNRVPVEQSINYYNMLIKNNIPAEMHIFEMGKHGFGLESDRGNVSNWGKLCIDWMRERGILK